MLWGKYECSSNARPIHGITWDVTCRQIYENSIWGSCQVPQDSLDRSPGKRHREGSLYAHLSGTRVRERRASLASISATGTPVAAVPCVLFSFLHIFPTQNGHFLQKSPNLALKRNAKRPFWPQTYTFPMKNQHFWCKNNFFDEKLTWNSHSRTRILFDAPTSPTSTPNQHLKEKSTFVRLLFHRIVILAQGFSVKVPIANVSAKSTFWSKIDTFSMGGLVLVFGWSWGGLGVEHVANMF